jgi:nucleoid DNA-binding protein
MTDSRHIYLPQFNAVVRKWGVIYHIWERLRVHGISQAQVKAVLEAFAEEVAKEVAKGNRVELRFFGTFVTKDRARWIRADVPADQRVPPCRTVRFRPGRLFRRHLAAVDAGERGARPGL